MGSVNIQMWQLLLFIVVTWFWGYLFGFFSGRTYGANEVLERYIRKKRTKPATEVEVIDSWHQMSQLEKDTAWHFADDSLKRIYWDQMTPEEQRRYG